MESLMDRISQVRHGCIMSPHWSPKLFLKDMEDHPVEIKEIAEKWTTEGDYLDFFEETRGYKSPLTESEEKMEVYEAFSSKVMLYFEELFLRMLDGGEINYRPELLDMIKKFSRIPITRWDDLASERYGAWNCRMLIKEPEEYCNIDEPDSTILERLSLKIGYSPCRTLGILPPDASRRNDLLKDPEAINGIVTDDERGDE